MRNLMDGSASAKVSAHSCAKVTVMMRIKTAIGKSKGDIIRKNYGFPNFVSEKWRKCRTIVHLSQKYLELEVLQIICIIFVTSNTESRVTTEKDVDRNA